MNAKLLLVPILVGTLAGCVSVTDKIDRKTGIRVTTVAVRGCGNPSQTMTWVKRPGKKEDAFASTGGDLCNTAIGAAGQILGSAVLPASAGINNTVISGSQSSSNQSTRLNINR